MSNKLQWLIGLVTFYCWLFTFGAIGCFAMGITQIDWPLIMLPAIIVGIPSAISAILKGGSKNE